MQTHTVSVEGGVLTKRYESWSRREPHYEWAALQALTAATDALVPTPLAAELDGSPPWLSMTLLAGRPLGGSLSAAQLDAVAVALQELWSVPADGLRQLAPASAEDLAGLRDSLTAWHGSGVVAEAHAQAADWLTSPAAGQLLTPGHPGVIGHGDPNLANYLWDGSRVRIVDFEDAGRSDAAGELANLVEHLANRQTDWTEFVRRFPVDRPRFAAARCYWGIFWLTMLRPGGPAADRNPPGTAEQQAERLIGLISGSRSVGGE